MPEPPFGEHTEAERFAIFGEACRILEQAHVPFLVGGGVAINHYGRRRPVKDLDLFVPRAQVFAAMDALTTRGGFHTRETSCNWLYKAIKEGELVDLVVEATGSIEVDPAALARAREVVVRDVRFPLMGPEDLLLRKIHTHNEERPDLYDGLSMVERGLWDFDWGYFLERVAAHNVPKVLGFFFFAQGEFGRPVMPRPALRWLIERVVGIEP